MKSEQRWERWKTFFILEFTEKIAQCEYNGINNLKSIIEDNFPELNKDLSLQIENFRLFINFYGKNKFLKCIQ